MDSEHKNEGARFKPRNFELAMDIPGGGAAVRRWPELESGEPVFEGKVRLKVDYWRVSQTPVFSDILDSPSWNEIISSVDSMLGREGSDYVFLEDLVPLGRDSDEVLEVDLAFGS